VQCFNTILLFGWGTADNICCIIESQSDNICCIIESQDKYPHRRSAQAPEGQSPLLRLHFFRVQRVGTAPQANVIVMKSTSRLHFVQRRDAAPMHCGDAMTMRWSCGGDALRRSDGDATAMRRPCDDHATAMQPRRRR
jgi:hypothetical protein